MLAGFRNLFAPPRHLILLVIAAWFGLTLAEKRSERYGISKADLNNITIYSLLAYVIGGRLIFALAHLSIFIQSSLSIVSPNPDLFESFGAAVSAVLIAAIYVQRQKLRPWSTLDCLTPLFACLMIGIAMSHLAAGTAFGLPTDLPWGIEMWNATRHPTQVYELAASILTLVVVWFKKPDSRPGVLFLTFVALTAGSHILIDAFRADSLLVLGGIRQSQLFAWLVLAASFMALEFVLAPQKVED